MKTIGALLATLALAAAPAFADTLNVPGDSSTIQGAIVLASSGDTILVAPGTYVETIDFLGKRLVIEGTGGAALTTIDAAGGPSAVHAGSAEPAGTALRGFTLTGGVGRDITALSGGPDEMTIHGGGGVCLHGAAHLDLQHCVISGNTLSPASYRWGGGVLISEATLTMSHCTLSGNTADYGAAYYCALLGHSDVSDCEISGNTAASNNASAVVLRWDASMTDCLIANNTGTGVLMIEYPGVLLRCTFEGNTGWGYAQSASSGADINDCQFLGNGQGGARLESGWYVSSSAWCKRCVFTGGDTLYGYEPWSTTKVENCTFDGANFDFHGAVDFKNCIIRNMPGVGAIYSDVEGLAEGMGTIDADPLWVNPAAHDYRLLAGSPCIDTGSPSSPLDADGSRADMGAIPFKNAFTELGGGVAGSAGAVHLAAQSTMAGGEGVVFALSGTTPFKPTLMLLGVSQLGVPFKGGTLWPTPNAVISLVTNGSGQLTLSSTWPPAIPSGFQLWAQFWHGDVGAVSGFAGSNGVRGTVP